MAWPTVATVVSRTARQLGLVAANITDPFTSTDPNILQLLSLLQQLGDELLRDYAWSQHVKLGTLTITSGGSASFVLPTDFQRLIDQTQWNTTTRLPVVAGLTPQQWEQLRAVPASNTSWYKLRLFQGLLQITPAPTTNETIYYEYRSDYWVATTPGAAPASASIAAAANELWFDVRLLVAGLKLAFRRAKGLDTTSEQQAFDMAVASATGGDADAPVLDIAGPRNDVHIIDADNAPDTGYGS